MLRTGRKHASAFGKSQPAFTLTELLCVIAIIGVLVAILIPVTGNVRESGRSAVCLSNLRQIDAAASLYSVDNKNLLVPICAGTNALAQTTAETWRGFLLPYLGSNVSVLKCPDDTNNLVSSNFTNSPHYTSPSSYGININSGLHDYLDVTTPHNRTSAVIRPSHTIFMADVTYRPVNSGSPPEQWTATVITNPASYGYVRFPGISGWPTDWPFLARHEGKLNVVYYDGHVATLNIENDIMAHPAGDPNCQYMNN